MTNCTPVSSHRADLPFITGDNIYELIPDKYDLTPGTTITVRCSSSDLTLVGQSTFSCKPDGKWSYQTKPYCTDNAAPLSPGNGLDEPTKIMIGVVSAIAGLIVIALIVMIITIWYRDRRRRRERRKFWEDIREERPGPEYRGRDGPSSIDMEMYGRSKPPLPPSYDYDYRSRDREFDRRSRTSHPSYVPDYQTPDYADYYGNMKRARRSRSQDDLDDSGKTPYVRDWVRRSSLHESDIYMDRAGIHGSRYQGRDPYLWRNSYM